ncbi:MAG TPA: rod shape-determining protein MreD [Solirubrobacteraceae bacterium]|jgi:rod shape-determining protein MreD
MTFTPAMAGRLTALGILGVIAQTAAISQVYVFGTPVDILPLIVAAVGLLTGAIGGAVFGFGAGLFIDVALQQTIGVTSLVYVPIGYGAGRLLELRDPAHGLTPMAVGAAATAVAVIGSALLNFMLGIDAPVSLALVRQIILSILVNALLAVPVYALVRRVLRPFLPEDPRRRRRRAYTTGGLSPLSRA